MATAESTSQPPPESRSAVPDAVRVQILATEHWSLLATRSMTWSEVMSRITIHLTICSASLVVLALVVQAFGFGTAFRVLSVGLASAMLVLGTLTSIRVMNASVDDQALVAGMNRLRAGYLSIDPSIRDYLVASWRDDAAGVMATLTMGQPRTLRSHVIGSTGFFMNVVNTIVAGTVAALITRAAGGGIILVAVLGSLGALAYLSVMVNLGRRRFAAERFTPPSPTVVRASKKKSSSSP
jgi:hypothetical protein